MEHSGSFKKYGDAPVFGDIGTGTMFDAYVWKQNGRFRMDVSWRPKTALAVTFSDDGIHWDDPILTLECDGIPDSTGKAVTENRGSASPVPTTASVSSVITRHPFWYRKRISKRNPL